MKEKIREIMSIIFECEPSEVREDVAFGAVEMWDSLAHMRLVTALEEEFGVAFSDEEVLEAISLPLIELILERKGVA